jgi:copper chaperone
MRFEVSNMTCMHCVRAITRAVQALDPQAQVRVDLAAGTVDVHGRLGADETIAALAGEGYPARLGPGAGAA